jgi:hypothetical protein
MVKKTKKKEKGVFDHSYESGWRRRKSGDFGFMKMNLKRNCPFPYVFQRFTHLFFFFFKISFSLCSL